MSTYIERFVRESNYIEGIAETTDAHIKAHCTFLGGAVTIPALVALVKVLQPNARFRNAVNISGVRVGNHIAPPSGPDIEGNLRSILAMRDPWEQHIAYETLHPFTDGNGRSGRAVWLHRHFHEDDLDQWAIRRGFLHSFYYHTLSGVRLASADRSPEGQDRNGLDAQHESAGPKDDAQSVSAYNPDNRLREALEAARPVVVRHTEALRGMARILGKGRPQEIADEADELLAKIDAALSPLPNDEEG